MSDFFAEVVYLISPTSTLPEQPNSPIERMSSPIACLARFMSPSTFSSPFALLRRLPRRGRGLARAVPLVKMLARRTAEIGAVIPPPVQRNDPLERHLFSRPSSPERTQVASRFPRRTGRRGLQ